MSYIDLPEPIWDAFHARSKTKGDSEGAVSIENGRVSLIHNGIHFGLGPDGFSAMRLSEFDKEKLEQIAKNHKWEPLFVKGEVTRRGGPRRRTRGGGDPACKTCNDTRRITVDKGDSEDCPDCNHDSVHET
jgi:hypothetical protein